MSKMPNLAVVGARGECRDTRIGADCRSPLCAAKPYSNFPAATSGSSYDYNEGILRDDD
jgi:hypothetical protein